MAKKREEGTGRPDERAVYVISVAAELAGVHPQTLRMYERKGLLQPKRSAGNSRRYSERDIERLRMIQELTQQKGINLAGARLIMEMESEIERMRAEVARMRREMARRQQEMGATGIVPLRSVPRLPWGLRP
jgi:MerR family transcriptional regulator/heat shock protein HspR